MNFIKRAWFAVIRKPGRSILLLVIFLATANLVLAGISIRHATKTASDAARQQLGATLTLSFNMQGAMQTAMSSSAAADSDERGRFDITQESLTEAMVNAVAAQKNILDYNIIVSTTAMADNFSIVQTSASSSASSETSSQTQRANENAANFTMPDLSIIGLRSSELYSDFSSGSAVLASGSHITENSNGQNAAVISQELASANGLDVGDSIQIAATDSAAARTVKIIGIFTTSSESATRAAGGNFGNFNTSFSSPYNTIYVDYSTALGFKSDASSAEASAPGASQAPAINSAIFYLDDPVNLSSAKAEIEKISSIDWDSFSISSDEAAYQNMVGAITSVGSFASIVVIIVSIIGAVILALILLLSVRERMFETGVLLAMGESRFKIVLQYAAEMLMIAVLAFSVSFFTGGYIGQKLGDYLVTNQVSSQTSSPNVLQENAPAGQDNAGTQFDRLNRMRQSGGVNSNVIPISSISVKVSPLEILEVSSAGISIILLATVVPIISIMRYKPRSILTRAG
jgi:putative ABC transport system permease protein